MPFIKAAVVHSAARQQDSRMLQRLSAAILSEAEVWLFQALETATETRVVSKHGPTEDMSCCWEAFKALR